MVYSTCSLEHEENLGQVDGFLADHPELMLHSIRVALPFRDHTDGAFTARIERRR
jgi:16S rRNA (cytosine967-C5)-methyltransferase